MPIPKLVLRMTILRRQSGLFQYRYYSGPFLEKAGILLGITKNNFNAKKKLLVIPGDIWARKAPMHRADSSNRESRHLR